MKKRTLSSLLFRTTKFIYSNVSSTQRPRYHGIVNEISEIIGFEIVAQLSVMLRKLHTNPSKFFGVDPPPPKKKKNRRVSLEFSE